MRKRTKMNKRSKRSKNGRKITKKNGRKMQKGGMWPFKNNLTADNVNPNPEPPNSWSSWFTNTFRSKQNSNAENNNLTNPNLNLTLQ